MTTTSFRAIINSPWPIWIRFPCGVVVALTFNWLGVLTMGWMIYLLPVTWTWWTQHVRLVFAAIEIATFIPFGIASAAFLSHLFQKGVGVWSVAAALLAFLIGSGSEIVEGSVASWMALMLGEPLLLLIFLVGVPVLAVIFQRKRHE